MSFKDIHRKTHHTKHNIGDSQVNLLSNQGRVPTTLEACASETIHNLLSCAWHRGSLSYIQIFSWSQNTLQRCCDLALECMNEMHGQMEKLKDSIIAMQKYLIFTHYLTLNKSTFLFLREHFLIGRKLSSRGCSSVRE